jgi:hypothetical protein
VKPVFLVGIPLLIITFAIYNMIAFLTPGVGWTEKIYTVSMMSGASWTITPEDALIAFSLLLLFVEIFKSTRASSNRGIIDHMLSMLLFIAMLVEFLLLPQAATSTFFLLMVISFVDVIGGFSITARAARRDVAIAEVERAQP